MVPDDLGDDEVEKGGRELGVELRLLGELAQPRDLAGFAGGVGGWHAVRGLEAADPLRALETLGEEVHERGIEVVDAGAQLFELFERFGIRVRHAHSFADGNNARMAFDNRVTQMLGVEIPIVQAPMGWIARSQLASAVSNAGAMGIIETSSGELENVKEEIRKMRDLTDKPFGVNIAQAFVRDPAIADFVIEQGVKFVTTSAGSPTKYTSVLKEGGLTVFHVVPNLAGAIKAVDAGVDGLIVEGGEGGGFKSPRPVASMVLLPLIRSKTDVPIIAAGGFIDGPTMAAALAMGAEGIQMGTRMVSAAESPVHDNWKQAIVNAGEADTVVLGRAGRMAMRALRTDRTNALEFSLEGEPMAAFGDAMKLYFGGDMEAGIALGGQVMGRIDSIRPVAEVIDETAADCLAIIEELAKRYPR